MVKVKTFTSGLKIFHSAQELSELDEQVISVSDACTTDNKGATIGIIRTIAYEEGA